MRSVFWTAKRIELRSWLETLEPAVVFVDPIYKILGYRSPQEIADALEPVEQLAEEYGTLFICVGHWNKASRGTSKPNLDQAYSGGANMVDLSGSSINLAHVQNMPGRMKLSFEKLRYRSKLDPLILRHATESAWFFDVDRGACPDHAETRKPLAGEEELAAALSFDGPQGRRELARNIAQRAECSESTADVRIREALQCSRITWREGKIHLCDTGP